MPHFGFVDENTLGREEALHLRALYHLRSAKRRLGQGKTASGILTLYDALDSAVGWYILKTNAEGLTVPEGEYLGDEVTAFRALKRSGVICSGLDFDGLCGLVERALAKEIVELEYAPIVAGVEAVMAELGVLPFDFDTLVPEKPDAP